jgi:predicted RNA-binding Zn-ribbon protein involved in translation (DUF1610 family)
MSEPKIIKGIKIPPEEAEKMDRSRMGVSLTGTPATEVEGQWEGWGYTQCPWCGHIGRSWVSNERYLWYTCGACGRAFRA